MVVETERLAKIASVSYSLVCHSLTELMPGEPAHLTLVRHWSLKAFPYLVSKGQEDSPFWHCQEDK